MPPSAPTAGPTTDHRSLGCSPRATPIGACWHTFTPSTGATPSRPPRTTWSWWGAARRGSSAPRARRVSVPVSPSSSDGCSAATASTTAACRQRPSFAPREPSPTPAPPAPPASSRAMSRAPTSRPPWRACAGCAPTSPPTTRRHAFATSEWTSSSARRASPTTAASRSMVPACASRGRWWPPAATRRSRPCQASRPPGT